MQRALRQPTIEELKAAFALALSPAGRPDGDDKDTSGGGDDKGDSSGAAGDDTKQQGDGDPDVKDTDAKLRSDEAARYRNERNQIKSAFDEQAARLKELEDKDRSKEEKLERDNKELVAERDALKAALNDTRLELAFTKAAVDMKFEDPDLALLAVKRDQGKDEFKVDDDGRVEGMKEALQKLAKAKPFLVRKEGGGDDDKRRDDKKSTTKSGGDDIGDGDKDDKGLDNEALAKKYPALRR
jgi:hypothetical protein